MIINLTNGFFIEIDDLNHTLKQKYIGKKKDGTKYEAERVCGYFGQDMEGAIAKYVKLNQNVLLAQETMELEEYVKSIKRINFETVSVIKRAVSACEDDGRQTMDNKLIERAIESAKNRIYKLEKDQEGEISARHYEKIKNQKEVMEVTVAALERIKPIYIFGSDYDWTCSACGTYHSTKGKFCSECGQKIELY